MVRWSRNIIQGKHHKQLSGHDNTRNGCRFLEKFSKNMILSSVYNMILILSSNIDIYFLYWSDMDLGTLPFYKRTLIMISKIKQINDDSVNINCGVRWSRNIFEGKYKKTIRRRMDTMFVREKQQIKLSPKISQNEKTINFSH